MRSRNYPHGIEVDSCAHLECDRPRRSNQLCHSHNRRMLAGYSIAAPLKVQRRPSEICNQPGCVGDAFLNDMCAAHWRKARLAELAA